MITTAYLPSVRRVVTFAFDGNVFDCVDASPRSVPQLIGAILPGSPAKQRLLMARTQAEEFSERHAPNARIPVFDQLQNFLGQSEKQNPFSEQPQNRVFQGGHASFLEDESRLFGTGDFRRDADVGGNHGRPACRRVQNRVPDSIDLRNANERVNGDVIVGIPAEWVVPIRPIDKYPLNPGAVRVQLLDRRLVDSVHPVGGFQTFLWPFAVANAPRTPRPSLTTHVAHFRESFDSAWAKLVGVRGFEPPAPSSRTRCATRLRYTPTTPRTAQAGLIEARRAPRKRDEGARRDVSAT